MEYKIIGDAFPVLICQPNVGEKVITQRGGMSWRTAGFEMATNATGGFMKGLRRSLAGGSIFQNHYTATEANQEIAFGLTFPGEIKRFDITEGNDIIAQKNAFIACTENVGIDMHFNRKLGAGLFAGEGFILERFAGDGMVFVEIDGKSHEYDLAAGEHILIDCGYLAAMEPTVTFDIETVKGVKNVLLGGEGLFLGRLTGPGKVWLQTLPITGIQRLIAASTASNSST